MKLNDIDCIHSSHTLTTRNPRRDREAPAQLEAPVRVEAMRATQQGTYLVRVEGKGANTSFVREIVFYSGLHWGIENDGAILLASLQYVNRPWWELWLGERS